MLVLRRGWGPWEIGRGASRYRYEYNVTMHLKMHLEDVPSYSLEVTVVLTHLLNCTYWRSGGALERKSEKIVETV